MYYNGLLKNSEMLFSENSKFYILNDHAYVTFSLKTSANFTRQYSDELKVEFFNLFDFKERDVVSGFVFTISEILERVHEEKQELFVYLIFKAMFIKKICPDSDKIKAIGMKVVRYQKKKFMRLLCGMPKDFVNKFQSAIYSAITDSLDKIFDIARSEERYHKYTYKTVLVAKEYLDDLEAFLNMKINVGYPRANKFKMNERPFESALQITEKIKNK